MIQHLNLRVHFAGDRVFARRWSGLQRRFRAGRHGRHGRFRWWWWWRRRGWFGRWWFSRRGAWRRWARSTANQKKRKAEIRSVAEILEETLILAVFSLSVPKHDYKILPRYLPPLRKQTFLRRQAVALWNFWWRSLLTYEGNTISIPEGYHNLASSLTLDLTEATEKATFRCECHLHDNNLSDACVVNCPTSIQESVWLICPVTGLHIWKDFTVSMIFVLLCLTLLRYYREWRWLAQETKADGDRIRGRAGTSRTAATERLVMLRLNAIVLS